MKFRRAIAVVALVAGSACSRAPAPSAVPAAPANVLIVTIDTLRADRLGVYGATTVQTPNLDRLAREGAWASQATVPVPLTRPSHVSLFTGLSPAEHGIRDNIAPALDPKIPLLAGVFERAGFSTAAFVSSAVLDRQSGLSRGFGQYSDGVDPKTFRTPGDVVTGNAITWLKTQTHFFAWVHLYDLHAPYEPPGRYATEYAGRPYDGCVAWSDELVGRLITALRDAGTLDRTLVVVTSDHGEGLGDHREDVHGFFLYESTLRVPLILRGPGVTPGTRLAAVARTIDLFPTLTDLAGLSTGLSATSGRSLVPALRGGTLTDTPAFAESLVPRVHFGWSDLRAVRDGRWKYILAPRPELYDLDTDPGEQRNVISADAERARTMRATLDARLQQEQTGAAAASTAAMPSDLKRKLGALGYLSGGPSATTSAAADPKDKIDDYKTLTKAMELALVALNNGRAAEAIDQLRGLRSRSVDTVDLHDYLGNAYATLSKWREAAAEYALAVAKQPTDEAGWRGLGESRAQLHDWSGAAQAFEKLAALAPGDALARMQLGDVYGQLGRISDTTRMFREAVQIDPAPATYWNALGTVLGSAGQMTDAERAFGEAASRDANNPQYTFNRGLALLKLGRRDDAIAQFRRAAGAGFAPARAKLVELGAG